MHIARLCRCQRLLCNQLIGRTSSRRVSTSTKCQYNYCSTSAGHHCGGITPARRPRRTGCLGLRLAQTSTGSWTQRCITACSLPASEARAAALPDDNTEDAERQSHRVGLSDIPAVNKGKLRLDAFLAQRLPTASRAKLQAAIRDGCVTVNGRVQSKAAMAVKLGDEVTCVLPPPVPMRAVPEDIPLDIMYEDPYVIVVNKPAGMVVHPSVGHMTGTLVNALLHHCHLPAMGVADAQTSLTPSPACDDNTDEGAEGASDLEDDDDAAALLTPLAQDSNGNMPIIRPGIVHRLDKGTSGLLVVAKDYQTHRILSDAFKARTVHRSYWSITLGVPRQDTGQVQTNIGRDPRDRKRMTVFGYNSRTGRPSVSGYQVLRTLAGGAAALVEWRLSTGRTHQIRVHAKHIGHPLFGDDTYGGAGGSVVSIVGRGRSTRQAAVKKLLKEFNRPALHAKTLGFHNPLPAKDLEFTSELPPDFRYLLEQLQEME